MSTARTAFLSWAVTFLEHWRLYFKLNKTLASEFRWRLSSATTVRPHLPLWSAQAEFREQYPARPRPNRRRIASIVRAFSRKRPSWFRGCFAECVGSRSARIRFSSNRTTRWVRVVRHLRKQGAGDGRPYAVGAAARSLLFAGILCGLGIRLWRLLSN